jgi:hypothetical protein
MVLKCRMCCMYQTLSNGFCYVCDFRVISVKNCLLEKYTFLIIHLSFTEIWSHPVVLYVISTNIHVFYLYLNLFLQFSRHSGLCFDNKMVHKSTLARHYWLDLCNYILMNAYIFYSYFFYSSMHPVNIRSLHIQMYLFSVELKRSNYFFNVIKNTMQQLAMSKFTQVPYQTDYLVK